MDVDRCLFRWIGPKKRTSTDLASFRGTRHITSSNLAGIQSVYRKANLFGPRDLLIIDEAHRIPLKGNGQYRTFIRKMKERNPNLRVVGLTATPYRMTGEICARQNFLNGICYEAGILQLIQQGFLCPVRTKGGSEEADLHNVKVSRITGDYEIKQLSNVMCQNKLVSTSCQEIIRFTNNRKKVLIFATDVDHGRTICQTLQSYGEICGFVCGDERGDDREATIRSFRNGKIKYLVNVNLLTVGFDASDIDCVAILRPTKSPGFCNRSRRIRSTERIRLG